MDILIIDDDPVSVFLAKLLISGARVFKTVITYENPVGALSFIQAQLPQGLLPKVILLDINMPLIDGWQLLESLKADQFLLHGKCLIYMLTSSTDISDVDRARQHPLVTDIIFKPLTLQTVHKIYEHAVSN